MRYDILEINFAVYQINRLMLTKNNECSFYFTGINRRNCNLCYKCRKCEYEIELMGGSPGSLPSIRRFKYWIVEGQIAVAKKGMGTARSGRGAHGTYCGPDQYRLEDV